MAFPTTFVYLAGQPVPWKFIEANSFSVTPNQRQDKNSYRDNNGTLHRTVLKKKPSTVRWTVPDGLSYEEKNELMRMFNEHYTNKDERKIQVRFYNDEIDAFETDQFYFVQPTFTRKTVDLAKNTMYYKSFDIELIGYGV